MAIVCELMVDSVSGILKKHKLGLIQVLVILDLHQERLLTIVRLSFLSLDRK